MKTLFIASSLAASLIVLSGAAHAQQAAPTKVDPAVVDKYVQSMWAKAPDPWKTVPVQDETQRICTETRNNPSQADFTKIMERMVRTRRVVVIATPAIRWRRRS